MPRALVMINSLSGLYNFRKEVIQELIEEGYEVTITAPEHEKSTFFSEMGCEYIPTSVNRRGTNIFKDLQLFLKYSRIIREYNPDIILTYTIKPNIYGGIAARIFKKNIIHTVTGLGSIYIQDIWQRKLIIALNKIAFKCASKIFFLNEDNQKFYHKLGIIKKNKNNTVVVPGSGVNLEKFKFKNLVKQDKIVFTFIGRVFKDKGIVEYLSAADNLVKNYPNVKFEVVGSVEDEKYLQILKDHQIQGVIDYLGRREDIPDIMGKSSCIVLPSYGEGRGTVLQEGAAVGRPLITCNTYGCKDNVEDGYNGYLCKVADARSLEEKMDRYINLPEEEKELMAKRSREKAEKEFNREIVVRRYMNEINSVIKGEVRKNESISENY